MRFAIIDNNNILLEMKPEELREWMLAYVSSNLGWMNSRNRVLAAIDEALTEVQNEFKRRTVYL